MCRRLATGDKHGPLLVLSVAPRFRPKTIFRSEHTGVTLPELKIGTAPDAVNYEMLLAALPTPAYACSPDGRLIQYNDHAAALWGRRPKLNHSAERFCGFTRVLRRRHSTRARGFLDGACTARRCAVRRKGNHHRAARWKSAHGLVVHHAGPRRRRNAGCGDGRARRRHAARGNAERGASGFAGERSELSGILRQ